MFRFSADELDLAACRAAMPREDAGAFVEFQGWVRNQNEGRAVLWLEYEAYEALAVKEGEKILAEARTRFDVLEIRCVHRVGSLRIGDVAVWVGVCAGHRGDAYRASQYVIDEVKTRVPIWKKEHYSDGDSGWINCEVSASQVKSEQN